MPLSDFPPELLLEIATRLDAAGTNALACTNRGLHNLLNEGLYYWDVTQPESRSLIWGATNGVEGTIQWAVDAAQKLNLFSESFYTALLIAAKKGHVPIVELLLKVFNNIDPNYLWGAANGVEIATLQGYVPIVELLLKLHDINPNFRGGSLQAAPLHLAAKEGHSTIVKLLLAVPNIDPDVRDIVHDCTPLIYACKKGHVSIVQQLLARNDVDVNARGSYDEDTPLKKACEEGHVEIINLLLAKEGIDINHSCIWNATNRCGSYSKEMGCGKATSLGPGRH
ncbi:Ankyrin repeat-containing domain protein [Elaphomyces granulatus]